MRAAAVGAVMGAWLGLADAWWTLREAPEFAGPLVDRLGTFAVAMVLGALLVSFVGLVVAGLCGIFLRNVQVARVGRAWTHGWALLIAAVLAVLVAAGVAGVGGDDPSTRQDHRPNIVLVSIDTLRADHLGAYGYARKTSPNIDALAAEGVLFQSAYSNSSWTLPSHASMFTGLDSFAHGAISEKDKLAPRFNTLAEILAMAGYATVAWVGTAPFGFLGADHDLDQGFSFYRHHPHSPRFGSSWLARRVERVTRRLLYRWRGSATAQVDSAIGWLRAPRREPFFMFMHFYDVHSRFWGLPYRAPDPFFDHFCRGELAGYTGCDAGECAGNRLVSIRYRRLPIPDEDELDKLRCLYDGAIAYTDYELGRLLKAVEDLGLSEDTVVIVTSDHGEAFMEHGVPLHVTLHEEVMRVPLVVRAPGGMAGKKAHGLVSQIDILPTVLELTGVSMPTQSSTSLQGRSLADVLMTWPASASSSVLATNIGATSASLRRDSLNYIEHARATGPGASPKTELYQLSTDGDELRNIAPDRAQLVNSLRREIRSRKAASKALYEQVVGGSQPEHLEFSDEERERLRALGYVIDEGS